MENGDLQDADLKELKVWVAGLLPEDWKKAHVIEALGMSPSVVYKLTDPNDPSFGQGKTLIRYLQLVGALKDAPAANPLVAHLATIEAGVRDAVDLTREALTLLKQLHDEAAAPEREDPPAHPQASD